MAYRHEFLVSMLCLIFLLNIHSTVLKLVPVFYNSMHLPTVQFSWHDLGSSGYTKQGYFSARTWIFEHWSFDIYIWQNCSVPRDSRSCVHGLEQIVSPSLQWILYGSALIDVNKGTSISDITKRQLLITATPLQHKGY